MDHRQARALSDLEVARAAPAGNAIDPSVGQRTEQRLPTGDGYELDLLRDHQGERWAFEVKLTSALDASDFRRLQFVSQMVGATRTILVSRASAPVESGGCLSCSLPERALTVPPGRFAKDTTYELAINWESEGLADGADFFANFLCDGPGGRKKQLTTWRGAVGKAGTHTAELKADGSDKWTLAVGIRGKGSLVVKRIRIKRK